MVLRPPRENLGAVVRLLAVAAFVVAEVVAGAVV
jgi:hypothetical protein